jgi:putative membrane protein
MKLLRRFGGKTMSFILATISTLCILISALLMVYGWYTIRVKKNRNRHKAIMITASLFALVFFMIYMTRTVFIGNVMYNGPENFKFAYTVFLTIHIIFATLGAIMGLFSLYLGFTGRFQRHKKVSPYTAIIWFISAATGIAVYLILFIIWPSYHMDTNLWQAIFGH